MKLILVRHGQTIFNLESRYQGHTDTKLSELGHRQAAILAERLRNEKIDAVYSSDLRRASETAEAIAAFHGLPVSVDERLRECAFGSWEGLTVKEISDKYPELFENYRRDSITYRASGGECLEHLQMRVVEAINEIVERHAHDTVLVTTHGGPIRAFVCHALGTDLRTFRKIKLHNCGITVFSYDSGKPWQLEALNDTCHLSGTELENKSLDETAGRDKAF